MNWVQRVSAEVRKEFPDRFLTTNGYANRDSPPIGITPDPAIWIMFAAIFSDTYHAMDNPLLGDPYAQGLLSGDGRTHFGFKR